MIDPSTIRRLAFIKYLYGIGIQQSKAPEPLAAASLLTFHDSVELFLQLASEHLNAGSGQTAFMDYWQLLSSKIPSGMELAQRESMRRLNKSRVALKHHGSLPSKFDIEAFRASVTAFFFDNTPTIFALSFDEISLTDFVSPDAAQSKLKSSEQHLLSGQLDLALQEIAISFAQVIDDYEQRKRGPFGNSPFFFGRDLTFHNSFFMGLGRDSETRELAEFVDRVQESIDAMQIAIKMLALGLDYRRYAKFEYLVPFVTRTLDGTYRLETRKYPNGFIPNSDDVRYCIDFVIETAIHLREFDYDIPIQPIGI